MKAIAKIDNQDGTKFALAIEKDEGVDVIGISEQGKEWEKWVDLLPSSERRLVSQILWSLGEAFRIDGPRVPTRAERAEIDSMMTQEQSEQQIALS
jgi:hypothetical protein